MPQSMEEPPESESKGFKFSFAVARSSERDLNLQAQALQMRLDKIISEVQLTDPQGQPVPIIRWLLSVTKNRKELEALGKVLGRVGEIAEQLDEIKSQLAILELAKRNPNRLAWMFGDFSDEVDNFLSEQDKGKG